MANTKKKPQKYSLTAEVEFSITGTSLSNAIGLFQKWMADAFNDSFVNNPNAPGYGEQPIIVPTSFETTVVSRDFETERRINGK